MNDVNNIDEGKKSLNSLREKRREFYKEIKEVHCPYFKKTVHFTSEGFNHIRHKTKRHERHYNVQEIRLKLLKYAPEVIRNSKTLQEYQKQGLFIRKRIQKKRENFLKTVNFYGFIAIIDGRKIKVIIRQIEDEPLHFWSVIPNWKTRKSQDGKSEFYNYTGNLSED